MGLMNAFAGLAQGLGAYGQAADRTAQLKLDQQRQRYMMDRYKAEDERRRREEMQQGVDNTAILRAINPTGYAESYGDMGNRPSSVTAPSAGTQLSLFKLQEDKAAKEQAALDEKYSAFATHWYLNGGPQTDPDGSNFRRMTGATRSPYEYIKESVYNAEENRAMRRDIADQADQTRRDLAAAVASGKGDGAPKPPDFKDISALRKEWNAVVDDFRGTKSQHSSIQSTANFKGDTGIGDVGLVYAMMKMFDPTSVVREGEFEMARKTSGVPDWLWTQYMKVKEGQGLSEKQRKDFARLADDILEKKSKSYAQQQDFYRGVATRHGIDPQDVLYDWREGWNPADAIPDPSQPRPWLMNPIKPQQGPTMMRPSIDPNQMTLDADALINKYGSMK